MKNNLSFAYYLNNFFNHYLKVERNLSEKTILSYNTTFKMMIEYLVNQKGIQLENINFNTITKEIILDFLKYIENDRNCSINTRNQRLAAIKSFYSYCQIENVSDLFNIQTILNIKFKKKTRTIMTYLTNEELEAVFKSVDVSNLKGRRDYILLTLLYDSAARADELVNIKISDLNLSEKPTVILNGKGNKKRSIPIMKSTRDNLIKYLKENNIESGYIFKNCRNERFNTKIVTHVINKYLKMARLTEPTLKNKKVSPHTFRHSKAMSLLEAGVALIYIRDFLGHSSVTTTEVYVQVSSEIKRKNLERVFDTDSEKELPSWNSDKDLLKELLSL